jgi:hypothetical protein
MNPGAPYRESDRAAARLLIERIGKCNTDRLAMEAINNHRGAVRDARLVQDLLASATVEQLRAAVVELTTPELRPALPVVLGRSS